MIGEDKAPFYAVYGSKHCKEPIDKLMFSMNLEEFLDYQNYVEIQNSVDLAYHLDQVEETKRNN